MIDLNNLLEKRANAWENAKKYLDENTDEHGNMSAEAAQAYDRMEAELVQLGEQIERIQRANDLEKKMQQPMTQRIAEPMKGKDRASDEYAKAFWARMRGDASPAILDALQEGTDSEGGYLVPEEFNDTLIQALEENNVMRQLCRVITTTNDRLIPIVTAHGTAAWTAEEAAATESDETFGQTSISAYKATRLIKVSNELLADSAFDIASYLASEFGRSFGVLEEAAFISGDGTNKPTGLLAATGGVSSAGTTASATAITFDELADLYYSIKTPYRANGAFLAADSTVKALRKIKDTNGQYIWQPSVTMGTPDMLYGRPVYTSPSMPALAASAKSIVFGDFNYYWIADRGIRTFSRLNELYAVTGQVGFLGAERVDGKLILSEALKCLTQKAS